MTDLDLHHLAAAYALDALDADERAAFEAHAATCEICGADVREYREAAAQLGALTEAPPRSELKDSIMAEIGRTRQLSPIAGPVERLADRRRPRPVVTAALAVAAAITLFVAGAVIAGQLGDDGFDEQLAAVLAEPDARFVELEGEVAGTVRVAWTADRAVVLGDGLVVPGRGLAYELWVIDADGATPTRLLDRAEGGTVRRTLDIDRAPLAWGVTIEAESGADAPTDPILFLAEV
ncbi:MAG: anti-sigma factor [Ilumatobacter sp.]|uniref:anti-sigma factor n=1 Tax=Ilumatobacter sp. TaxID=1967498 RepID=UPI002614FCF6|nr:anti-sigma factor [Ilumatobacter sp.]MDJ0771306.1 anti-sigma factor [Ilumatobacter sp.]